MGQVERWGRRNRGGIRADEEAVIDIQDDLRRYSPENAAVPVWVCRGRREEGGGKVEEGGKR